MAFGPLGPEDPSWRKICLVTDSELACPLKPPAAVGGIPVFDRLAAILARLEFAGIFYLMRFAG